MATGFDKRGSRVGEVVVVLGLGRSERNLPRPGCQGEKSMLWLALLVQRCLSNTASFVFCGITCLMRLSEFAPLFATFEESVH